jgi:hypothetical protein
VVSLRIQDSRYDLLIESVAGTASRGIGHGGSRSYRTVKRDSILGGVTRSAIRRLARRGGVKRTNRGMVSMSMLSLCPQVDQAIHQISIHVSACTLDSICTSVSVVLFRGLNLSGERP